LRFCSDTALIAQILNYDTAIIIEALSRRCQTSTTWLLLSAKSCIIFWEQLYLKGTKCSMMLVYYCGKCTKNNKVPHSENLESPGI